VEADSMKFEEVRTALENNLDVQLSKISKMDSEEMIQHVSMYAHQIQQDNSDIIQVQSMLSEVSIDSRLDRVLREYGVSFMRSLMAQHQLQMTADIRQKYISGSCDVEKGMLSKACEVTLRKLFGNEKVQISVLEFERMFFIEIKDSDLVQDAKLQKMWLGHVKLQSQNLDPNSTVSSEQIRHILKQAMDATINDASKIVSQKRSEFTSKISNFEKQQTDTDKLSIEKKKKLFEEVSVRQAGIIEQKKERKLKETEYNQQLVEKQKLELKFRENMIEKMTSFAKESTHSRYSRFSVYEDDTASLKSRFQHDNATLERLRADVEENTRIAGQSQLKNLAAEIQVHQYQHHERKVRQNLKEALSGYQQSNNLTKAKRNAQREIQDVMKTQRVNLENSGTNFAAIRTGDEVQEFEDNFGSNDGKDGVYTGHKAMAMGDERVSGEILAQRHKRRADEVRNSWELSQIEVNRREMMKHLPKDDEEGTVAEFSPEPTPISKKVFSEARRDSGDEGFFQGDAVITSPTQRWSNPKPEDQSFSRDHGVSVIEKLSERATPQSRSMAKAAAELKFRFAELDKN